MKILKNFLKLSVWMILASMILTDYAFSAPIVIQPFEWIKSIVNLFLYNYNWIALIILALMLWRLLSDFWEYGEIDKKRLGVIINIGVMMVIFNFTLKYVLEKI